jgi:hypothetical protein
MKMSGALNLDIGMPCCRFPAAATVTIALILEANVLDFGLATPAGSVVVTNPLSQWSACAFEGESIRRRSKSNILAVGSGRRAVLCRVDGDVLDL